MKLKPYPSYKDSGVEWLGEVPASWVVNKLKRIADIYGRIGFRGYTTDDLVSEGDGAIALGGANLADNGRLDLSKLTYLSWFKYDESPEIQVSINDLILGQRGTCGKVVLIDQDIGKATINPSLVLIKHSRVDSRFLCYWLMGQVIQKLFDSYLNSTAIPMLTQAQIGNIFVCQPSNNEQIIIASYLDRETAKLDTLIAKQEKLIELLQEKRQVIISLAVTKGLNPDAKMKDSGVEWLGEMPEHWESLTIRRVSKYVTTGGTPSEVLGSEDISDGFTWYTPGDFGDNLILTGSSRKTTQNSIETGDAKLFPARSVLIVSIGATLGKVGYSEKVSSANQQINAVIPNSKINGYFLAYSLSVKYDAMKFLSNASTIGIINQEKTKEIWLAVPPLEEQNNITKYLDLESARIDTLIEKASRSIELAKEHRSALISAAVTGKIDVREAA